MSKKRVPRHISIADARGKEGPVTFDLLPNRPHQGVRYQARRATSVTESRKCGRLGTKRSPGRTSGARDPEGPRYSPATRTTHRPEHPGRGERPGVADGRVLACKRRKTGYIIRSMHRTNGPLFVGGVPRYGDDRSTDRHRCRRPRRPLSP